MKTAKMVKAGDKADHMFATLAAAGVRITATRRVVVEVVAASPCLLTPEEVHQQARKRKPSLGLASVYRTLSLLNHNACTSAVVVGRSQLSHHCTISTLHFHIICQKCHSVVELEMPNLTVPLMEKFTEMGFVTAMNAIAILGTCQQCHQQ